MKTNARVVVVGGGMMGASLLYHLALEGCSDTVLIEKSELTSGSTWHAAGQCPSITGSYNLAKIHAYSNQLYPRLEALTGQYVSWHAVRRTAPGEQRSTNSRGSNTCTATRRASAFSMDIVGLDEIKRLNPFLTTDNVIAAAWTTRRRTRRPVGSVQCAGQGGARLGRHRGAPQPGGRHSPRAPAANGKSSPSKATIIAEMVVNAAGCYARQVAAMVGADAPITNMQHHYVVTHPIQAFIERSEEIPVMRDSYTSGYFRQEQKSGLMGSLREHRACTKRGPREGFPDWEASNELFPDDLDRIAPWLERAIERMPIFGEVGIRRVINGAIPHTPDGAPLLGPGGGLEEFLDVLRHLVRHRAGRRLRQVSRAVDAARRCRNQHDRIRPAAFRRICGRRPTCATRCSWTTALTFTTRRPGEEEMAGRPRKTSPLYERLRAQGCVHTETFGWERPKWFSLDGRVEDYSYRRNNVFEVIRDEVAAVHERVGAPRSDRLRQVRHQRSARRGVPEPDLRQSSTAQDRRHCARASAVAEWTDSGRDDGEPPGPMIASTPCRPPPRSCAIGICLTQSVQAGESVRIENVTEERGVLVLSGPRSRELLAPLDRCASGQRASFAG